MLRPRIIPCLLIKNNGLVKTIRFSDPKYVGDPLNAVKIFNEKEVDELIVLDISTTKDQDKLNFKLITNLAYECRMPLCYGGGVRTVDQFVELISLGVEKVSICTSAIENNNLVKDGKLLLAIENRYDYKQFIGGKDPHVNLYFTSFLPRWMGIIISNVKLDSPYVNYLYSFFDL